MCNCGGSQQRPQKPGEVGQVGVASPGYYWTGPKQTAEPPKTPEPKKP